MSQYHELIYSYVWTSEQLDLERALQRLLCARDALQVCVCERESEREREREKERESVYVCVCVSVYV